MLNPLRPKPITVTTEEPAMSTSARMDLEKFGYTAGCPACEVHRERLPVSGQGHTVERRKRLEDAMTTDTSTATRVKATRVGQAERQIFGRLWGGESQQFEWLWSTQTRSILRPRTLGLET